MLVSINGVPPLLIEHFKVIKLSLTTCQFDFMLEKFDIEKLDFYTQHLFIQEYSTHPFIDVYVTKLNKGDAFDFVVSKLFEKSDYHGKIIYLGDSENDNPAFRKSDISIGVNSDNRLNPDLDCTYYHKV